jgi:hypothetical protein
MGLANHCCVSGHFVAGKAAPCRWLAGWQRALTFRPRVAGKVPTLEDLSCKSLPYLIS